MLLTFVLHIGSSTSGYGRSDYMFYSIINKKYGQGNGFSKFFAAFYGKNDFYPLSAKKYSIFSKLIE